MQSKTPVVIITGYLGAGKTTFLRKIISSVKKKSQDYAKTP
ncbi:MAG: GTP-binding protein [Nitrospinota bacterium]